jgi:hypothetical protein
LSAGVFPDSAPRRAQPGKSVPWIDLRGARPGAIRGGEEGREPEASATSWRAKPLSNSISMSALAIRAAARRRISAIRSLNGARAAMAALL